MSTRFVTVDRETAMLFPPDLRDWVGDDDPAHLIIELVNQVPEHVFRVNTRGTGSKQYPPSMMLALLLYCYVHGIFSSRKIEAATYSHVSVRYVAANLHPDHDSICKFRRENGAAIEACFVAALRLARLAGLLRVGNVSVDGTLIRANASKQRNVRYSELEEMEAYLKEKTAELLEAAEQADREEDDSWRLPPDLRGREKLRERLSQAKAVCEERARQERVTERANTRRKSGKPPETPEAALKAIEKRKPVQPKQKDRANLTDPDSRFMGRGHGAFDQYYNAQAVADADGSQLILSTRVIDAATDHHQLRPNIAAIPEAIGPVKVILADSGYATIGEVQSLEAEGYDVYVSVRSAPSRRHPNAKRLAKARGLSPIAKSDFGQRMQKKLQTPQGRALYRLRRQSIEPCFGIIKHVLGFRQFLLRGIAKVNLEWKLMALAYNMKRLSVLLT